MSTERKPGSRAVRDASIPGPAKGGQPFGSPPEPRQNRTPKGSTKTVSPRKSFKRKPRK